MRVFNGQYQGDAFIHEEIQIDGMVTGSITVEDGGKLLLNGMCCEDLIIESGASVRVNGTVIKNTRNTGGDLEIYGVVYGDVYRESGETFVHRNAHIHGEIN